ncbi:MAG: hypothetical protein C0600_12985 [Ignavibacteria bacterium]|nr:MAG: hypothetical protein C0600_12985 [Ignavibacteria bacterium]
MRQRRLLLTLLFLLCAAPRLTADVTSMSVVYKGKTVSIPAFQHKGVLYASLDELAAAMSFKTYVNNASHKIEVRIADTRLKMTDNNPFIVVLSHKDNVTTEVFQLPIEVMRSDVAFYMPMASFVPLLSRVWKKSLLLDQSTPRLTVTTTSQPVARVTGGLVPTSGQPSSAGETASANQPDASSVPATVTNASTGSETLAPTTDIAVEAKSAYDITRLTVDTRKNGTLIRLHAQKPLKGFEGELKEGSYVVTIPNATVDINELRQTPTDGISITGVTAEQLGPNTRLTFTLKETFTSEKISRDVRTGDLLLSLFRKVEVAKILKNEQSSKQQDGSRSKWKLDCIVIDPGHGGRDPGAIGVTGVKEKNIVLGVALKLGKLIERKMPGVKVVYTRKDDTFIPLDKRGQIANAAEGKLFISIHCNSTEKKPSSARGFEVYILRPGRTEEAIRIAEFENSVIKLEKDYEKRYAKLDNESFILINMAQSAYVRYSERCAELMHEQVKGSNQIRSRGVMQAGFYVLVGASMPSVLVESGFLSNRKEEQFLSSRFGQQHLANLFYTAIEDYAKEYQKSLKD